MAGLLSLGQRQGPQLLGQPVFDGLLRQVNALPPVRPMADAADEQMAARAALLQPAAPAPRARDRVSGWRVFDRVLGGQTVTEGLDAERARLQTEADRPRLLAEQARLAGLARTYGPLAELAVGLNPDKAGEAFASNIEGYTLGAGGVRGGINGPVAGAPTTTTVNDQIYQNDPLTRTSSLIATADPAYSDQTQRMAAETAARTAGQNYEIQQGQLGVQQGRLSLDEQAAGFTLSPNGQRYDRFGNLVAQAPAPNPVDAQKATQAAQNNLQMIGRTRQAITRARDQTGVTSSGIVSGLIPFNQSRANLDATLDTIRSNLSFAELAQMRANSPTGGALGGIAVRELDLLGSTIAGLSQDQSPEELKRSFDIIDQSLARYEDIIRQSQSGGNAGGLPSPQSAAEYQALPSGTQFRAPDGTTRIKP